MRSARVIAAFAALAVANPLPQDLDWSVVDAAAPIPTASVPVVNVAAAATTVSFDPIVAASSVAAAVSATASSDPSAASKRGLTRRGACAPQSSGAGPASNPDTPLGFESNPTLASLALAAPTPSGYTQTFSNLNASNNAYGYMGYTLLKTYDVQLCSSKCNAINGCAAFNIYFERDPLLTPDASACPNPPSTNNIKCVFWGGPVTTQNAVNYGQYQAGFEVVIAGSNGYVNNSISPAPGYNEPNYLGNAAINAPLDCNGRNTYMGVNLFTTGPFDAGKCAAACSAVSAYNVATAAPGQAVQTCQFFNTYILLRNGTNVGQYCSMYNETWGANTATNVGQYRGYDHYTIEYSYSFSNATNPGTCTTA